MYAFISFSYQESPYEIPYDILYYSLCHYKTNYKAVSDLSIDLTSYLAESTRRSPPRKPAVGFLHMKSIISLRLPSRDKTPSLFFGARLKCMSLPYDLQQHTSARECNREVYCAY